LLRQPQTVSLWLTQMVDLRQADPELITPYRAALRSLPDGKTTGTFADIHLMLVKSVGVQNICGNQAAITQGNDVGYAAQSDE
jgi:hypothetical protein